MTRIKRGTVTKRRHNKVLKLAKGYRASSSKKFKVANQQVMKAMTYSFAHRRKKKGDFRKLWITRINAAARMNGISYSRMMNGLHNANVEVDRKILADLAVNDMPAFTQFVDIAKANLK